ncbi:MAG: DUF2281 domain-containing protein [Bacteroidetes bacterium]|nr:MAG: DUF2281 domain-containing protein [Bacteroidota bacterium]
MLTTAQLYSKIELLPEKYQQHLVNYIDLLLKEKIFFDNRKDETKERELGFLMGVEYFIADDFDEPLDDFKEYM